jgi:hypothetical protein
MYNENAGSNLPKITDEIIDLINGENPLLIIGNAVNPVKDDIFEDYANWVALDNVLKNEDNAENREYIMSKSIQRLKFYFKLIHNQYAHIGDAFFSKNQEAEKLKSENVNLQKEVETLKQIIKNK